jgi:hypothetical protein
MKTISNVLVLIADGVEDSQGDKLLADEVEIAEHVRVSLDFDHGRPVGKATIRREGNLFFANLEIVETTAITGLYPCVGGTVRRNARALGGSGVDIFEVALCRYRNADERIPRL